MTPEQRGKYARTLADFTPRKVIPVANCWTCDRCRSCKVLDGLTEEERKELQEANTLLAAGWFDINITQPLNDIQVLVRLEREMLGGWYSVATFGRIPLIGSLFAWDAPKPTHWMHIPACS